MKTVLTLITLFLTFAGVFGQASQEEFIIGASFEPARTSIKADNSAHFATLSDCGFNTIIHSNWQDTLGNPLGEKWCDYTNTNSSGPRYLLERVAAVGGLRVMIADTRFCDYVKLTGGGKYHLVENLLNATVATITSDYTNPAPPLPPNLTGFPDGTTINNNIILGYTIADEPWPLITTEAGVTIHPVVDRLVPLMKLLNDNDPDRIAWANLLPYNNVNKDVGFANWDEYVKYVTDYMGPDTMPPGTARWTNVASFDYYPFCKGVWNTYDVTEGGTFYFHNLELFATRTVARKMNFWAYPLSVQHGTYDTITEVKLRFTAHAPILYGAKGLVYYTYSTPATYNNAMVTPYPAFTTTNIYDWAQTINTRIANMGPTLMNLTWRETIHAVDRIPDSQESVNTDNTTGVIRQNGTSDSSFAVGVFKGEDNKDYLIVMNLDREHQHSVTVSCVNGVSAKRHLQTTDGWEAIGGSVFTLHDIQPAGIELIRLDPDMTPVTMLLLD